VSHVFPFFFDHVLYMIYRVQIHIEIHCKYFFNFYILMLLGRILDLLELKTAARSMVILVSNDSEIMIFYLP